MWHFSTVHIILPEMTTDQTVVCCTLIKLKCIFPTKLSSIVSVVISDWLIVTYASRNCIIDLRFTHHVSATTISLIMPVRLRRHCCEYTNCHGHERRTHTRWHIVIFILLRTRIYIVFILGFCSPWYNRYGWLGVKTTTCICLFLFQICLLLHLDLYQTTQLINISIFRWITLE